MDAGIMAILTGIGGRLINYSFSLLTAPRRNPVQERIQHLDKLIEAIPNGEIANISDSQKQKFLPAAIPPNISQEKSSIATACVA